MPSNFLFDLGRIIGVVTYIYVWLILIRVLLSWINPNPYSPIMRILSPLVDPALNLGRRYARLTLGGLDFSPVVVIIAIQLLGAIIATTLQNISAGKSISIILPMTGMALIALLNSIANIIVILLVVRIIMSLAHPSPYNIIVRIVYGATEPLLAPLRRYFPVGPGGLDIRAIIVLALTILAQYVVLNSLARALLSWA